MKVLRNARIRDDLTTLFNEGVLGQLGDAELLDRVASGRGDASAKAAFGVLVERHGPMVRGACLRILGNDSDADDAFQASFLVLARKAGSVRVGDSLGRWLHGVSVRVAKRAKGRACVHRRRTLSLDGIDPVDRAGAPDPIQLAELRATLDEEIARLSSRDRSVILLCDLEGLTQEQAARRLRCPIGTVQSRLHRARGRLRDRLRRRGLTPSTGLAALLTPGAARAAVPVALLNRTVQNSLLFSAGRLAIEAVPAVALARGVLTTMIFVKLNAAVISVAIASGAVAWFASDGKTVPPSPPGRPSLPVATASASPLIPIAKNDPNPPEADAADDEEIDRSPGTFRGLVLDPNGNPLPGARVYIVPNRQTIEDPGPVRTRTDADGRFTLNAPDLTYAELDGLPARRQGLLIASAEGYAPDWMVTWGETRSSFRTHWDPVKGAELTLRLAPDDVPLRGRFLDPDGRPLAGARVQLVNLDVPKNYDLDAHLELAARRSPVSSPMDTEHSIHRQKLGALPGVIPETRTDADGRFELAGLGRDRLAQLSVSAPGVVDTFLTAMTRNAPDVPVGPDFYGKPTWVIHGSGFTLQLKPGRTLSGVVRDQETGEPIPGMRVGRHANSLDDPPTNGPPPEITDENGRFTISGLHLVQNDVKVADDSPQLFGIDPENLRTKVTAASPPGGIYVRTTVAVEEGGDHDIVIECPRGIPFRLEVVDEQGSPVEAEVTYWYVTPNPIVPPLPLPLHSLPVSRAARQPDGVYQGFVLPGPGALLVKPTNRREYRPAYVDPKAFFAPGKTDWTAQEQSSTYGTPNTLDLNGGTWIDQHDYAAIILVNPPEDSGPIERTAVVVRDRPRQISLIDPDGEPVSGVQTEGLTFHPYDSEPRLRVPTFSITGLHPDRVRRITFFEEDRQLIGFLMARGDGDAPYTVQMEPWGTLTGRIVDEEGEPFSDERPLWSPQATLSMGYPAPGLVINEDPEVGVRGGVQVDPDGRFRIDRLIPGQRYSAKIQQGGGRSGMAFENLVLQSGETRDLGDIRSEPPVNILDR